jgi:hypothetical protein
MASAKCQEEAKQSTKTGMLRDNGSNSYNSYWCHAGTCLPPCTGSNDTVGGEVNGTSPLEFGVLVLPSPQSRA